MYLTQVLKFVFTYLNQVVQNVSFNLYIFVDTLLAVLNYCHIKLSFFENSNVFENCDQLDKKIKKKGNSFLSEFL